MKIVYECVPLLGFHIWEGFPTNLLCVLPAEFIYASHYPLGTRLTIEITITEPGAQDAARLDDDTAGKLNAYMNGGE